MRTAVLDTVAVVGAGVVGAAVAWQAAESGHRVVLVDPQPRSGASWVAGGMLAPITEAWPGDEELLALGTESLAAWPAFADQLRQAGHDPGLRTDGTLVVAVDGADRAELRQLADFLAAQGRDVATLTGTELRAMEPSLATPVRGGLSVPGDLAVDNRKLLDALLAVGAQAGVEHRPVAATGVRSGVVELAGGDRLIADVVVLAAGAWSGGLHPALRNVIRPVKGEILRLRQRSGSVPPPGRTIRGIVGGRHVYLVPRDDGGLVVGATQYEAGFDTEPMAAGVRDLLQDAERLMPGIADYALVEASAGLRPGTPDNLPVVRRLEPGVLAATGHGRSGILLLPGTVSRVAALLAHEAIEVVS
jgi:glycine oxidase